MRRLNLSRGGIKPKLVTSPCFLFFSFRTKLLIFSHCRLLRQRTNQDSFFNRFEMGDKPEEETGNGWGAWGAWAANAVKSTTETFSEQEWGTLLNLKRHFLKVINTC